MRNIQKFLLILCLIFGYNKGLLAQCPGAPSVTGFSGGTGRAPVYNRCLTLLSTPTPYVIGITANQALGNFKVVWGDGKPDTTGTTLANGIPLTHIYDSLGEYPIKIISKVGSCWDTIYGTIRNLRPVSSSVKPLPSGQNVGCAPHTIVFEDQTNNALPGTTLTWNFGDGTIITRAYDSANKSISHTYASGSVPACTTQVSLTANNGNCTIGPSTYTVSPILILDKDQAVIGPPTPGSCNPARTYTFPNNTVVNCPTLHAFRIVYWDFGDGTSDAGWNTNYGSRTHTFPDTGSYTITLMDSNDCGLSVTTRTININTPPNVGFTATPRVGCMPLLVNFNDTSTGIGNTRDWQFGDAFSSTGNLNTSTVKAPVHRFDSAGVYTVRLRVSNPCTAASTPNYIQITQTITVYGKPRVLIGGLKNGCTPLSVSLKDSTKNIRTSGVVYSWNFGNGQTSTAKNPAAVVYTVAGTYQVKLIVTDTCGIDSVIRTIRVDSVPTARFVSDTVCKFDTTHFNAASSFGNAGDVLSYKWYIGASPVDSSKTGINANYRYSGAGFSYNSVLKVTTNRGCIDYDTNSVKVSVSPNLNIVTTPSVLCDTGIVTITGDTTGSGTPLTAYKWTFGAGTTDTAYRKDTSYRFPNPGTYTLRYTVNNSINCSTTVTKNITVNPLPDARPTASFFCHQQFTRFRDSSTVGFGNTIDSTKWDFTADNSVDSITPNPTFKYPIAGIYKVKLRVVTNKGCANTDSITITINALPGPAISTNGTSKCKLDSFVFGNTTTGATTFRWRFGDGTPDSVTTSLASLNKIYTDTGAYLVKMIAISAQGCLDSSSATVNSRPFPVARFTVNDTLSCAPKLFVFTNTSLLANNYVWHVNGNETSTAINRPDTNIATSGQSVLVSLIATNIYGCRPDTIQQTIHTISNPTPDFTMSTDSGCGPLLVNFANASSGATSYQWSLGNATSSASMDTAARYLASAFNDSSYVVKLIAFNGPGCKDSISKTVTVFPKPLSSFTQDQTANCGPLPVSFTNTSVHKFGGTINDLNFDWQFGNGDTSQAKDPVETFIASPIQDSLYTIRLIATSIFGCSDTSQKTVRVYPNPRSAFTVNNDNGCGPLAVNFNNTSVPNDTGNISIMSFDWNFSNGLTSSSVHPNSVFVANLTKDTLYPAQLIASSEHGCKDTAYHTILVFPKPHADFTMPNDSGCSPYTVVFTNTSIPYDTGDISIMSFVWDMGNGFGNITQNGVGQYLSKPLNDSSYTVKLYATSEHGCKDTVQKKVVAHPVPVAAFTNNISQGCGPLGVQFTGNTVLAAYYKWNFGDGGTSLLSSPLHTFQSYPLVDSVFSVSFSVQSIYGCESDTVYGNIITRYRPVADFIPGADSICSSGPVSFTNQSIGAISNSWNFGNGNTSTAINPVGNFAGLPGFDTTYSVRLIVTSPYACKDTAIKQVTVNPLPDAQFDAVAPGCTPLPVSFNNTSLRGVSHQWDFGDGTSAVTANPNKTFANGLLLTTQQFTVTLKTVSQSGCIDTAKRIVTIYPKPAAAFSTPVYQGCGPLVVPFTNQSASNFSGSVGMTSLWNFGTGDTSSQTHPIYPFVPNAVKDTVYSVMLTAISEFGCKDTAYNTIRVFPKPTAGFTVSDSVNCGPMNVIFTNTSVPNDTGNITIMSFVWDLANGFSSVLRNPASQYINTGIVDTVYQVRLIGTSEHGCKDTTTRTVTVKPKPIASFTQDKVSDCGPFQVTFANTSLASDQYNWQFGNGDTSTLMAPAEIYQSYPLVDSNYVVKLVTRSAYGCVSDTARKTITARYLPLAAFNTSDDTICNPASVSFYNASLGGATNKWQFGNGDSAISFNPIVSYTGSLTNDTSFMARLIVTTSGMCRDTAYKQIVVNPLPEAQFDAVAPGCTPLPVSFNNTSLRGVSHQWDFGDGTSAVTANPNKTFANGLLLTTQQFTVTLKTVSQSGCIDTAKRIVTIYPKPAAAFSTPVYQGCGPLMVPFTNQSASNFSGSVGMTSLWNFGTGDTSSQTNPIYPFVPNAVKDTVYSVMLTAISEFGCKDTAYNTIRVFPKPTAGFTVSDSVNCGPMNVIFTNTSVPNDTGNITIMSFVWDLANGFSSVLRNPASQYINSGIVDTVYQVRLIGTSEHGCKDTTIRTVTVKPKPIASFTQDKVSDCGPFQVTFTNTSLASDQYNWQFGNGDTSTLMAPAEIYQSYPLVDSNYVVKLVTHSAYGCVSDTARKTITARYLPLAGFYTSADTICNPASVSFYNASLGVATNNWQFGNGDSSVAINPIVSYTGSLTNDTAFTTRLIVTTSGMCRDTTYKTITVKPAPFASFATITPGCTPLQSMLANTSAGAVRYEWDFGSGVTDTAENPTKEFVGTVPLNNTQYLVTLKAYSPFGCMDTAKQVAVVYPKPLAAFMPNVPEGCGPLPISFTNQSAANLSGSTGMTFEWRFGNGDTSTQKTPNMLYPVHPSKDTLYTPRLISISQYGCRDTLTKQIRVFPQPVAKFSTNTASGCTPLQVNFTNQSIPNDTGTIDVMTFVWNYGNGLTSISKDVVSEFINTRLTDSTFTVQLFATSEHGCRDTSAQNILVYPKPVASFTQDKTQGCGPFAVNFTNTSAISPVSYWLFGDGDSSFATSPSHTYRSYPLIDSFYSASLITESALGCKSDTVRKTIIGKYIPDAGIVTSSDSTCNPGNISFYNASVGGASNSWNFGNGNTSTAINPVATFNGPLVKDTTYKVRLVVTSPANCRDTTYKVIKVNPVPEAIFASAPPACTPYPVVFNNSSLRAVSYEWEFGDGGLSGIPNPLKIFTNNVALTNRDYTVTLKAYSASGCFDTAKRVVTVFPLPLVNFTASKTLKCDTAEYLIINSSQGAAGYTWKQNDMQVSNQFAPMVYFPSSYNNDTSYNIKLVGTSISGCKDSVVKPVTIKPLVRAAFSSNGSASCSNINVSFTNETANGLSYFWLFGDGTGSPLTSPQHRYTTTGSYDVKLIAYDAFGCSDTAIQTNSVNVYEVPTANFLYSPPTAALPNSSIVFSNLSFISSGNLSHQWIFGDAASSQNSSSLENPSHTFSDSGNFNVLLVVNSIHNCYDTLQQVVRIHPHPPVPAFRLDPPQGCSPLQVQFINQSEYADAYEWTFDDGQTSTDKDPVVIFKYPGKYGAFLRAKGPGGERQLRKDDIVEVFELPRANFFVTPLKMVIPNSTVTLTNISSDGVAWKWRIFSEGKMYFTDSSKNSTFTFSKDGKYDVQLVVRNDKGCLDSLSLPDIVEVIKGGQKFIGNAFTPDGDGINDIFKPVLQGVVSDNYTFEIYNRWGERVFRTHDVNAGWDGTFNGKPAPVDAYVWLIKGYYVGNIDFGAEGNVTLIR